MTNCYHASGLTTIFIVINCSGGGGGGGGGSQDIKDNKR